MKELPIELPNLIATAGAPGGLYVIDFNRQEVHGPADPSGGDAGEASSAATDLRGIGVFAGEIYAAAGNELWIIGPDLRPRRKVRCTYLRDAQGLCVLNNHLFVISRACDSILAFDLERQAFFWALQLAADGEQVQGAAFDPGGINGPGGANGPPARGLLGLDSIFADSRGLFVSGAGTGGIWHVGKGNAVSRAVDIPGRTHDARPFRDGVLFNDVDAGALRYVGRDGAQAVYPAPNADGEPGDGDPALAGSPRGLCAIDDRFVAAGSSPSMVSIYDLEAGTHVVRVGISTDSNHGIHSLAAWPR